MSSAPAHDLTRTAPVVLNTAEWQARAAAHVARVRPYTVPRRERRARGESHPVHDFLFQYYSYSAGKLETWHPAPHEVIEDGAEARSRFRSPVSVVGVGMRSHPGVASRMFRTLAEEGINIQMISTSEIKISVAIDEKYLELAVRVLHRAFGLDQAAA